MLLRAAPKMAVPFNESHDEQLGTVLQHFRYRQRAVIRQVLQHITFNIQPRPGAVVHLEHHLAAIVERRMVHFANTTTAQRPGFTNVTAERLGYSLVPLLGHITSAFSVWASYGLLGLQV